MFYPICGKSGKIRFYESSRNTVFFCVSCVCVEMYYVVCELLLKFKMVPPLSLFLSPPKAGHIVSKRNQEPGIQHLNISEIRDRKPAYCEK
jgi:hypothetical protein